MFNKEELGNFKTRKDVIAQANVNKIKLSKHLENREYEIELAKLQAQLVSLQRWVHKKKPFSQSP